MRKKELFNILSTLTDDFYQYSFVLLPYHLHAERLMTDCLSAFLLREGEDTISRLSLDIYKKQNSKDPHQLNLKKELLLKIISYLFKTGTRRAMQLSEESISTNSFEVHPFYRLLPKIRFVLWMKYVGDFSIQDIGYYLKMSKTEVLECLHNGRFLLSDLNKKSRLDSFENRGVH